MMERLLIFLVLILCIYQENYVRAEIIEYNDHFIMPDHPEYLIIPKFDKGEVPHWSPGRGKSYIDLTRFYVESACSTDSQGKLKFNPPPDQIETSKCSKTPEFDLLMFEAPSDKSWQDYWDDSHYCCTQELVSQSLCPANQLNTLIVPTEISGALLTRSSVGSDVGPLSVISDDKVSKFSVTSSGSYVLLMAECDPDAAPVVLHGVIESLDPYGYLPADLFGDLPFYLALSCMYFIIGVTWMVLCVWYWDQLMPLQMWISAVLIMGMIETTMLFAHYLNWNDAGRPALSITILGLIFGVTKRALSRILVQLVALGYGVVRPSLGEDMTRVLYLGGTYFVASLIYTLLVTIPAGSKQVGDPEYDFISLLVFLLAVVDTTFYIWIFTSINNLMVSLAARKQSVKYLLYRNFRNVLFALLFFTCIWALYGSVFFLNDSGGTNANWRDKWTVDALWELIYFMIFVAVAVLWAPSKNAQRYAFSIELAQLEDDEEYNTVADAADAASAMAAAAAAGGGGGAGGSPNGKGSRVMKMMDEEDQALDGEYGGRLHDEKDPFQGTGALDPAMAFSKKN